jgi:hypothetical protein
MKQGMLLTISARRVCIHMPIARDEKCANEKCANSMCAEC